MNDMELLLTTGREILGRMVALSKSITIYPQKHPAVMGPAAEICNQLSADFDSFARITFNIVKSDIYIEKFLLREESLRYSEFIQSLSQRGVSTFAFEPGVTPEMIAILFSVLYGKESAALDLESLKKRLADKGVSAVGFGKLVAFDLGNDAYTLVEGQAKGSAAAKGSYGSAMRCLDSLQEDVMADKLINMLSLRQAITSLMEDFLTDREAVLGIMSIKTYDEYLFHHSVNVAITALSIAKKLPLSENMMKTVGICGLLHDIGKLKIPREIMNKPGSLTEVEWATMRRHSIEGAQILMRYENLGELPVLAALEHHAGYDLSGYPTLKGKNRPHAIARIISIADVYEALTANRSYRPARSVHVAVSVLIESAGKLLDPLLVKLLLNTFGVFPPGSLVRLRAGDTAVVVEPNEDDPFSPKVRLLAEHAGNPPDDRLIDTSKDPAHYAVVGLADSSQV